VVKPCRSREIKGALRKADHHSEAYLVLCGQRVQEQGRAAHARPVIVLPAVAS